MDTHFGRGAKGTPSILLRASFSGSRNIYICAGRLESLGALIEPQKKTVHAERAQEGAIGLTENLIVNSASEVMSFSKLG
jgi:hypothetical protein